MPPPTRHVLLVGAGHAHLHVAANARRFAQHHARLTLVDPGEFWYSGLATGMLGGMYAPDDDTVDPRALCERSGAGFVRARLVGLDRQERLAHLDNGDALPYDALSLNLGSEVDAAGLPGVEHAWAVKPIENLARLREHLEAAWRAEPGRLFHCVVIGGGPTGCEIAANLAGLAARCHASVEIVLLARGERLIEQHPTGAAESLARALRGLGVRVRLRTAAQHIEPDSVLLVDGARRACDTPILATGLRPPRLLDELGLPTGDNGGLRVEPTLRCVDDDRLFAAGDCIDFPGRRLPKLGVFGVREAPVLLDNLLATLADRPLRRYRPQRRWLSILNLGDGTALALYGRLWWRGRAAMWLKHRLDTKFLERYRARRR